ncbi:MAG TPA: IS110 family transposase [Opitutaceae bacterium]|nr:IS110 family transposase [Opitutaceae bacterium]
MNETESSGRVIGLDLHPDVFSAAALVGRDAGKARVAQQWGMVPTAQLECWAKQLQPGDVVVIEASGNTFECARSLRKLGIKTAILESQRAGQVRTAYCANDRTDAVKLARVYLSGLAKLVWEPDETTRERREVLHRYRVAVTDATRARNRIKSFLSDHRVRLRPGVRLTQRSGQAKVMQANDWTERQRLLLEEMLGQLEEAESRRNRLTSLIAREVVQDPQLLKLLRLLGVRHIIAYAAGAVIGEVTRFSNPKKLVAYLGLTPRTETSGLTIRGAQGLAHCGRRDLRSLLVQAAQNALMQRNSPLHKWGWKLCLRKAHKNVAVAAIARKLAVAIWYAMRGLILAPQKLEQSLRVKLQKVASCIHRETLRDWGYASNKAWIEEKLTVLLDPT